MKITGEMVVAARQAFNDMLRATFRLGWNRALLAARPATPKDSDKEGEE